MGSPEAIGLDLLWLEIWLSYGNRKVACPACRAGRSREPCQGFIVKKPCLLLSETFGIVL